jgi:hypothetical protein
LQTAGRAKRNLSPPSTPDGVVKDQSQLQGVLARIANNALVLISVSPEDAADVENRGV